jgi:hypothetical protein
MAALTAPRATPLRLTPGFNNRTSQPMEEATTILMGAAVCLNAAGYLVNASATTGLKSIGVLGNQPFEVPSTSIVNSGADGAKSAEVILNPTAFFENDGVDPVVLADVTGPCYWSDNKTVCHTATGKSYAGKVVELTSTGVWVEVGAIALGDGLP